MVVTADLDEPPADAARVALAGALPRDAVAGSGEFSKLLDVEMGEVSGRIALISHYGCAPQTLNDWAKKTEVDSGKRPGVSSEMAERMKALERENRELRQANEILRKGEDRPPLVRG